MRARGHRDPANAPRSLALGSAVYESLAPPPFTFFFTALFPFLVYFFFLFSFFFWEGCFRLQGNAAHRLEEGGG